MRHSYIRRRYHPGRRGTPRLLRCEPLEHRWLLSITVDTLVDEADGSIDDGDISLRDAIAAAAPGETIDFHASLDGGTILLTLGELAIRRSMTIDATALPEGLTIDASGNDPTPEEDDGAGSRIFLVNDRKGNTDSPVTMSGLTLTGGDANGDGGAVDSRETLTITSSTISGNSAVGNGGGIRGDKSVSLTNSRVHKNVASSMGGGIVVFFSDNTVSVKSSTISGNSAERGGGLAAYWSFGPGVTISNSTISGNSANQNGGGILAIESFVRVAHSTITCNSAGSGGGGVSPGGITDLVLSHSIVAGNTDIGGQPDLGWGSSVEYSLIGDNTGTGFFEDPPLDEAPVGSPDANGNLIGGPINGVIDPLLSPLADNGGPTWTHALLAGSPAIDAGDPLAVAGDDDVPEFDQRGISYTRVTGGRIDMGAHERQNLTVEILEMTSPTITPVDEVIIQFSGPVTGVDLGDLELLLNGGENLLADSQNLSTTDNQTFVLGGVAEVATASGFYTLRLVSPGSGIVDANGSSLDAGDSISWAMGRSVLELIVDTLVDESDGSIDDGDVSLRDAIRAAAPGETIDFDPSLDGGTILLTLGELSLTRPITIDATALAMGLVIDAAGNDPTPDVDDGMGSRIFEIDDGNGVGEMHVTLRGLTLTGGDVNGQGGAIHTREEMTVISSTISGNSAAWRGGGISGGNVTVTSSTISDNSTGAVRSYGGGIHARYNVAVTSSTISGNSVDGRNGHGGGIWVPDWVEDQAVTISNSIVAGNTASTTGPDLHLGTGAPIIDYSLIGDNTHSGLKEAPAGAPDMNGNLIGGPTNGTIDPLLGPLANNGGPTWTQALLAGSPAIDAGDPDFAPPPDLDQRGNPRVADGNADGVPRIDMGSFEVLRGDVNGDGEVNGLDVDPFVDVLLNGPASAAADVNADGSVDGLDVDPFVATVVGADGQLGIPLDATSASPTTERSSARLRPARHVHDGDDRSQLIQHRAVDRVMGRRLRLSRDGHRSPQRGVVHQVAGDWQATVDRAFGDGADWIG
jgi:hypothetical protein